MKMFKVATYNCLASEYLTHWEAKKGTPSPLSASQQQYIKKSRLDDIVKKICSLDSAIVGLQEISSQDSQALIEKMKARGYSGEYQKFHRKSDGVATFYRDKDFTLVSKNTTSYHDDTGRSALFLELKSTDDGSSLTVCSTHFQGGPSNVEVSKQQIQTVAKRINAVSHPVILLADCNFTPQDPRFQQITQATGLQDSLNGQSERTWHTSKSSAYTARLDYIFQKGLTCIRSEVDGKLDEFLTPAEPSDHIPVTAQFERASQSQATPSSSSSTQVPPEFKNRFEWETAQLQSLLASNPLLSATSSQQRQIAVVLDCHGVPHGSTPFIRGSGSSSLSWERGKPLQRIAGTNQWTASITANSHSRIEYKILLNDDTNLWENCEGNHSFSGGAPQSSSIHFNTMSQPTKIKTIIYAPNNDGSLSIRGSGPGMAWDRSLPASQLSDGNFGWEIDCEANTSFEFKFLRGEHWEQGSNHLAEAGNIVICGFQN